MTIPANLLTIETSRINGDPFPGVAVSIELMDPMLAVSGMPTETIVPSELTGMTDATNGVFTIMLVPSSIVGRYRVTLNESYSKEFDMPNAAARLSGLPDLTGT